MALTAVRIFLLYILASLAVRIMGKRQIGELQPLELVVTILLSEIAVIPMQDTDIPILNSVIAVMLLVSFELILSVVTMKSPSFRKLLDGNPVTIIRNGKLDQKELKRLRFTVDDLMAALRQKDIFDITKVSYAVIETNGSLSINLKNGENPVTAKMLNLKSSEAIPFIVVSDGEYIRHYYSDCQMSDKEVDKILKNNKTALNDVLIMTVDKNKKSMIIKKEK